MPRDIHCRDSRSGWKLRYRALRQSVPVHHQFEARVSCQFSVRPLGFDRVIDEWKLFQAGGFQFLLMSSQMHAYLAAHAAGAAADARFRDMRAPSLLWPAKHLQNPAAPLAHT